MRKLIFLMLALIPAATLAGEPKKNKGTETWSNAKVEAPESGDRADLVPGKPYDTEAKRLSFRERRRLGITRGNVIRTALRMNRAGELDASDPDLIMNQVVAEIVSENPEAYKDVGAVDWDAIFAFLEKLLPLLIMLFGGS
jgi:hypothetical protein